MTTPAAKPTLLYTDPIYLEHDPGDGHPENAARLAAAVNSLRRHPIQGTQPVLPRVATNAEIERVHAHAHVECVARTADVPRTRLDMDTATSPQSYEAALKAAGGTLQGVEAVVDGEAQGAFALVRPPGHHAEPGYAKGFCLFNNIAIAAAHALDQGGLRRVLVLDPDVHHGNGTQHSFWQQKEVLYVSSHRRPFFPGTGALEDIGAREGRGYNVNLPLDAGATDADLLYLYERIVDPIVNAFAPDLILVSAGFDMWKDDPIGGCRVTEDGFHALFALYRRWADRHCPGRMVCTLEGGYDPNGVLYGIRAAIEAMAAEKAPDVMIDGAVADSVERVAYGVRAKLLEHWPSLKDVRI